jgi:hypothetical protein
MAGGISGIETYSSHVVPVPVAAGVTDAPKALEVPYFLSLRDRYSETNSS